MLTICSILVFHVEFAEPEIAKGDVACVVEEDVLRLQIAVDDVEAVQALEGAKEFRRVKARPVDVEALVLLQVVEEFAAIDEC